MRLGKLVVKLTASSQAYHSKNMIAWNLSCHWFGGSDLLTLNKSSAPLETCWWYHIGMTTHCQGDLWILDLTCQGYLNYFRAIHAHQNGGKRAQLIKSPPQSCRNRKLADRWLKQSWDPSFNMHLSNPQVQEGVTGSNIVSSVEVSSCQHDIIPEATSLKE